jgi:UDP-3-O-[3-hydroxymyristoyl] glucosamine N-acyltransferase
VFNTEARASLSEFADLIEVVRDARFFTVGKIPTRTTAKLVPVNAEKHLPELLRRLDGVAAVVCPAELVDRIPAGIGCAVSPEPQAAAYRVHERLCARPDHFWTSFPTRIAAGARVHPRAYVAERDVVIGEGAVVGPNATILERVILGEGCQVGANSVIGTEAYETAKIDGRDRLQVQAGGVRVGARSVFLSGDTIARSVFPVFTEIGEDCFFDNLIYIAHDCVVGAGSKMCLGAMIAGRVELGEGAYIGPNATVSNGVTVGAKGYVTIGSTVVRDVEAGAKVTGNFAIDHATFIRNLKASVG